MYKLAYLDIWMVYTMSFKENFTRLCNQKGESPTTVCKKLGLSNAAYSCWTDESIPRKSTLIKIADYFGVSVDFLLGKTEQKEVSHSERDLTIQNAYDNAAEEIKAAVRKLLDI